MHKTLKLSLISELVAMNAFSASDYNDSLVEEINVKWHKGSITRRKFHHKFGSQQWRMGAGIYEASKNATIYVLACDSLVAIATEQAHKFNGNGLTGIHNKANIGIRSC